MREYLFPGQKREQSVDRFQERKATGRVESADPEADGREVGGRHS